MNPAVLGQRVRSSAAFALDIGIRVAKLGDTVPIRISLPYSPATEWYWNKSGYPCDREGVSLIADRYFYVTLDTPDKVDAYNETNTIPLDGFTA